MTINETTVILRKLTAGEGMLLTDKETETMRATEIYLGKEDTEDNYVEIPENTPLPEIKQQEREEQPDERANY